MPIVNRPCMRSGPSREAPVGPSAPWWGRVRRVRWSAGRCAQALALLVLALLASSGGAWAAERQLPSSQAVQRAFEQRVRDRLIHYGLLPEHVSLLLYSTREDSYLYRQHIDQPRIAASNAKLATTYAALQVLSPDYRWRTRFHAIVEHDDAGGPPRQGLRVRATGDPTLTAATLQKVALELRARGVRRLDGHIYLDGDRFDDVEFPAAWGDVSRGEPWFAPVSPFIVEKNIVEFLIASQQRGPGFDVRTVAPGFTVVSALEDAVNEPPAVRVTQHWQGDTATFTFLGALPRAEDPYQLAAAVERPRVYFYRYLRAALERAGIKGEMPLGEGAGPAPGALLYTVLSPPLREVIVDINKNSSNLGAEVLLRTMGLLERQDGVSSQDGLVVLRRTMAREFAEAPEALHLVDGSGLSRRNRVTAHLLVRLLNRVRADFSLGPEFINSLSVALVDGTLQYRNYPWRVRGRLRAKTGTLKGVSNISGYLQLRDDVVIFSFLINDASRPFTELQDAQDRTLTDLYDALLAREDGRLPPPTPETVQARKRAREAAGAGSTATGAGSSGAGSAAGR